MICLDVAIKNSGDAFLKEVASGGGLAALSADKKGLAVHMGEMIRMVDSCLPLNSTPKLTRVNRPVTPMLKPLCSVWSRIGPPLSSPNLRWPFPNWYSYTAG